MARRRKKHTKRRRSRRVGALSLGGKDTGMKLLAVGAGFLLGGTINGLIDKALPKEPVPAGSSGTATVPTKNAQMVATVGGLGIGGLLLLRRQSGTALKLAGGVLAGASLKRALGTMGILSGFQSVPVIGRHRMAGYQSTPVIGGTVPSQLSGRTPPQLSGYRPAGSGVGAYVNQGSGVMGSIGSCEGSGSGISGTGGSGFLG